ncbi:hypothetical protein SLS56_010988 [Neofusicoccum ribis]|uniref:Sphingomyelin phosphodiesterase n=1 Tax=Neofusicoccum ribis TaxID=45134 RepID=A0ABR3SCV9_9PEZI
MVSSSRDLAKAGKAMLDSSIVSPADTRRWLKPVTSTSNLRNSVGRPWEIYHFGINATDPVVDIYTKTGSIGRYSSYFGLAPDHNVGFSILAYDEDIESPDLNAYADVALEALLAIDQLGRAQAKSLLAGIYQVSDSANSSLVIRETGDSDPGLSVETLVVNGKDWRTEIAGLQAIKPEDLDFPLLFRKMSLRTGDMEAYCHYKYSLCDEPGVIQINESKYFKPKPEDKNEAPVSLGDAINVLHLSDWHLDPRYDIGSEGNCSTYMCCRPYRTNKELLTTRSNASWPASRFGNLYCDTPADLGLSLFTSLTQFVNLSDIAFALFTGDVVSHDDKDQQSRAYVEYEETVTYETFKAHLGSIPIYASLGNHDSLPSDFATPYSLSNSTEADSFSWNYRLLASLWSEFGWLDNATASAAAKHYGGYAYTTPHGLKIISINTDFWYTANPFNFFNFTNPDWSGVLRFLIEELQAAEDADQRVWIIGHVPSGYGGTGINGKALHNPSALFYSIVRRFSPVTIAGIFWGHLHYDQLMIYYDYGLSSGGESSLRNTTDVDYAQPLAWAHIAPSITPLTGLNAGWTLYQVDAKTFEVVNWQTYIANMSEANSWTTPDWQFQYDARGIYDQNATWPRSAPLNATFWHRVTEQMLENQDLVDSYNLFETKSSILTKNCSTTACAEQKVCYIRSGSTMLGDSCPQGNGPF